MDADSGPADTTLPYDLLVVVGLAVALAVVSLTPALSTSPLGPLLAVVALLLPGYALIAALFPRRLPTDRSPGSLRERAQRVDAFDRLVLSIASGLVVTPLLGIALEFSPFSITTAPVAVTILGFVVVASGVAAYRRRRLPPAEQYRPAERWAAAWDTFDPRSEFDLLTVVVALAVVVALGGVLVVASTGQTGERFTEFYLLNGDGDQFETTGYPNATVAGEPVTVTLGIENREGRTVTYTVVTRVQRVERLETRTRILEQNRFDDIRLTVGPGETVLRTRTVRPELTGSEMRLTYLLYRGEPPAAPTTRNAYRRTHLWLNVTEP